MGRVDFIGLSSTRMVAAVQTANQRLELIVWDIGGGGGLGSITSGQIPLTRVGEAEGKGEIREVALAARNDTQIVTAVRTPDGNVKISLSYFKTNAYALGFHTDDQKLRIVSWIANQDEETSEVTFEQGYQLETYGTTPFHAMARISTAQPTIVTPLRTSTGVLKVILWRFTDSNLIYLLHGDEIIQFVHLRQGSIPNALLIPGTPVSEGQFIGRMGDSGRSSGAHLHMQAVRVPDELVADIDLLIEQLAAGEFVGSPRPLHFHGVRAMRTAGLVPGWSNNPMTPMQDQGVYFEDYAIWPDDG